MDMKYSLAKSSGLSEIGKLSRDLFQLKLLNASDLQMGRSCESKPLTMNAVDLTSFRQAKCLLPKYEESGVAQRM